MRPKRKPSPYHSTPVVKFRRPPGSPTKNQIRAKSQADARAVQMRWKTLIGDAQQTWSKLHPQELAKVNGDFHVLAGLVQLRYQLGRAESDRQVHAFFGKHEPAKAPAEAPAALAA
jgi:hypothetical protein